ncbi:MAG: LysR family transcriptional regulator [Roseovarius sp.]|uniref:LysR family transcriptional regulator n=1 Tax=Roseovarius sp. TaxID=1486281 RepID=UPI0032EDD5AF
MHLKLRHLEVFHAVMEEGSVSKAADRLYLTQPAISIALSRLEDMLGFPLFHRSKGHFAPRPEAYLLHMDAELSILAVEQFSNRARLIKQGGTGLLRVGAIGAAAFGLMPGLVARYTAGNPLVEIDLSVRSSHQISYLVGNGQCDIGLVEAPVAAPSLVAEQFSLPCVCIFPAGSELEAKAQITPADLAQHRLIGIQDSNQVDRQLRAVSAEAGVDLRAPVHGFFFAVVRRMVAEGAGVAIVDALNGCLPPQDGVIWRPFAPEIRYDTALIVKAGAELSLPARAFIELIRDEMQARGKLPDTAAV